MSEKELTKVYQPQKVEDQIYQMWLEADSFKPTDNESNETFTVMIPPPNVTGILHIGHVLNNTIQDVLIRRARIVIFLTHYCNSYFLEKELALHS